LGFVADIVAVAFDQPRPHFFLSVSGQQARAHLVSHVSGHRRVAVVDRLALALQAPQRCHQGLGLRLEFRIVELAISVRSRRQRILRRCGGADDTERQSRPQHRETRQGREPAYDRRKPAPTSAFRNSASSSGTCSARMSPMCWYRITPWPSITKVSGTPEEPSSSWTLLMSSPPIRLKGLP